ncbi:MAG: hypothetical protein ACK56F_01250, partial [bacterium]
ALIHACKLVLHGTQLLATPPENPKTTDTNEQTTFHINASGRSTASIRFPVDPINVVVGAN